MPLLVLMLWWSRCSHVWRSRGDESGVTWLALTINLNCTKQALCAHFDFNKLYSWLASTCDFSGVKYWVWILWCSSLFTEASFAIRSILLEADVARPAGGLRRRPRGGPGSRIWSPAERLDVEGTWSTRWRSGCDCCGVSWRRDSWCCLQLHPMLKSWGFWKATLFWLFNCALLLPYLVPPDDPFASHSHWNEGKEWKNDLKRWKNCKTQKPTKFWFQTVQSLNALWNTGDDNRCITLHISSAKFVSLDMRVSRVGKNMSKA